MTEKAPFSWSVPLADLPAEGIQLTRRLTDEERAALAAHAGIVAIESLEAAAEVRPWAGGVEAVISFTADVIQSCVVTLEPVRGRIDQRCVRRYLPDAGVDEGGVVDIAPEEEEPPEPLAGDTLDLAPALAEELILALDPYPRAPGAVLPESAVDKAGKTSPFAALERLKTKS